MSKANQQMQVMRQNTIAQKRLYKAHGQWQVGTTAKVLGAAMVAGLGTVGATQLQAQADVATTPSPSVTTPDVTTTSTPAPTTATTGAITPSVSEPVAPVTTPTPAQPAVPTTDPVVNQANQSIDQAVSNAAPVTTQVGGSLDQTSDQDVTGWSDQAITSTAQSQVQNIQGVGQGNQALSNAVASVSGYVDQVGGKLVPSDAIDVSSMTPEQIIALASQGAAMVSATGSADSAILSASSAYTSDINNAGGVISAGSLINTADDMTVSQIDSSVRSQVTNISDVASHDREIEKAAESASAIAKPISGVVTPGSNIDGTGLTTSQIASLHVKQSEMLSATAEGDQMISEAVDLTSGAMQLHHGSLSYGSDVNTADNMTPSEVLSIAKSQVENLSAAGKADTDIDHVVRDSSAAIISAGGDIHYGSGVDMTGKTPSEIGSYASSVTSNVSAVASADSQMVSEVTSALSTINSAGGYMKPGSNLDASSMTPEEIASEAHHQSEMISATASADSAIESTASAAKPDINGAGGVIKQDGVSNTAWDSSPSQIASHEASQAHNISDVAKADSAITSTVKANSSAVSAGGGVLKPGSNLDLTGKSSAEVASIAKSQADMVNATGSADVAISSAVNHNKGTIESAGGSLIHSGVVNTADNMTTSQIASQVSHQTSNIDQTAKADSAIHSAEVANSKAISLVGGVERPGSTIDVSSMTSEQISALASQQVSMVNATGSADTATSLAVDHNKGDITANGGTIKKTGDINTADDMTGSQIGSIVASQNANMSQTAAGDRQIHDAVTKNSQAISNATGTLKPGSAIDTTHLTSQEIASIATHQSQMVSATGSADADIVSHVHANQGDITANGGTINKSGDINTADNMMTSQIASLEHSQAIIVDATGQGDKVISTAVSQNSKAVHDATGSLQAGSAIDTTHLTTSQIASIAAHQSAMVSATGSADADVKSHVDANTGLITGNGGTIKKAGDINTADNMTPSQIASLEHSQAIVIDATGQGDKVISTAVSQNSKAVHDATGSLQAGSAIDTTHLSTSQIGSIAAHQSAMVSATGSADADIKSHVDKGTQDITNMGGTISKRGDINTADNMTTSQIGSLESSQAANVDATAAEDKHLSYAVKSNSADVQNFGGSLVNGGPTDVNGWQAGSVASYGESMASNVVATGSATRELSDAIKQATSNVNKVGGVIEKGSVVDVTSMNPSQIGSMAHSESTTLSAVASADGAIGKAIDQASKAIHDGGGQLISGSHINGASMKPADITSQGAKQSANIVATGSADTVISNAVKANQGSMAQAGGVIHQGAASNVENLMPSQIGSLAASQSTTLHNAGSSDSQLASHVKDNQGAITGLGGTVTSRAAIDGTHMTSEQMSSAVSAQASNMSAVAHGDQTIKDATGSVKYSNTVKAGSAIDATGWSRDQVAANVASQVYGMANADTNTSAAQSALGSAKGGTITAIGGSVGTLGAVDANQTSYGSMASMVNSDVAKVEATSSAAGDLQNAIKSVSPTITANGGTVTASGAHIDTTSMTTSAINQTVDSQKAKLAVTASADSIINAAIRGAAGETNYGGGRVVTVGGAVDATNMDAGAQAQFANSVAGQIAAATSANDAVKGDAARLAGRSSEVGGKTLVTNGGTVNVANAGDAARVTASVAAEVSRVNGEVDSYVALSKATEKAQQSAAQAGKDAANLGANVTMSNVIVSNQSELDSVAAYNQAQLQKVQDQLNQFKQAAQQTNFVNGGYTRSGNWSQGTGTFDGVYAQVHGGVNDANNVTVVAQSNRFSAGDVVTGISVAGITPEGDGIMGTVNPGNAGAGYNYDYANHVGNIYKVRSGSSLRFRGAVTTADGQKHDLVVKFDGWSGAAGNGINVWADSSGSLYSLVGHNGDHNNVANTMTYWIDNQGDTHEYVFTHQIVDIDVGQRVTATDSALIGVGGGIHVSSQSGTVSVNADVNLGRTNGGYGINVTEKSGLTDRNSAPDGVVQVLTVGNGAAVTVQNDPSSVANIVVQGLFGTGSYTSPDFKMADVTVKTLTIGKDVKITPAAIPSIVTTAHALSTTYRPYDTKIHDTYQFTYHPLSTTYRAVDVTTTPYSTTYHAIDDRGGVTPMKTTYHALSTGWQSFSSLGKAMGKDGKPLNPYNSDGSLNERFTGYTPLSTTWKSFSSLGKATGKDGKALNPYKADGSLNEKFTGFTPLSVTWKSFSSDGTKVNPYTKDGKLNPHFTGYTPLSTTYQTFSTDGKAKGKDGKLLNPLNPDGTLNKHFTGYAPLSTKYVTYESDGSKVPNGHTFTGYQPYDVHYVAYETDGSKTPNDGKEHTFTGYRPLDTTVQPVNTSYVSLSSDGAKVPTHNPDGSLNEGFTGYAPLDVTYYGYESDATKVPNGHRFTGYAPLKTKYHHLKVTPQPVATPVSPAAPAAAMPLASALGMTPNTPAAAGRLPQTGQESETWALLGMATLLLALGLSARGKRLPDQVGDDQAVSD